MKAATGELQLTVITLIAIAAVISFFWFMWPTIQNSITEQWTGITTDGVSNAQENAKGNNVAFPYIINY